MIRKGQRLFLDPLFFSEKCLELFFKLSPQYRCILLFKLCDRNTGLSLSIGTEPVFINRFMPLQILLHRRAQRTSAFTVYDRNLGKSGNQRLINRAIRFHQRFLNRHPSQIDFGCRASGDKFLCDRALFPLSGLFDLFYQLQ